MKNGMRTQKQTLGSIGRSAERLAWLGIIAATAWAFAASVATVRTEKAGPLLGHWEVPALKQHMVTTTQQPELKPVL
jgi:hypothetical protein